MLDLADSEVVDERLDVHGRKDPEGADERSDVLGLPDSEVSDKLDDTEYLEANERDKDMTELSKENELDSETEGGDGEVEDDTGKSTNLFGVTVEL